MKPTTTMPTLLGILCLLTGIAYAQNAGSSPTKEHASDLIQMLECEGINDCTAWTFRRGQDGRWKGHAEWRTGEKAVLEIDAASDDKIVISRTDVVGKKAGLTATYTGSLSDAEHLGGVFISSYQGQNSSGNWYAVSGTAEMDAPNVLHFCAVHCYTFTQENNNPRQLMSYSNLPGEAGLKRVLTIERFSYNSVVIHRVDTRRGQQKYTHDYTGRMSDDGSSLSGRMSDDGKSLGEKAWRMTWGVRLNELPQDDQERDRWNGKQQQQQIVVLTQQPQRDWIDVSTGINNLVQIWNGIRK
jgi:hypothetical protein